MSFYRFYKTWQAALVFFHKLLNLPDTNNETHSHLHAIASFSSTCTTPTHASSCKGVCKYMRTLMYEKRNRNMHSATFYVPAWETSFSHTHTHSHKHTRSRTQRSLRRSFVIWRRIYSHALCAAGSDLRHSSGNLCPSSCGLIRLCTDLEDNAVPGIMREIQSITHLQSTFQCVCVYVCVYAHVSHFLCVLVHPSAWLTVSVFLLSQCACSCPTFCVCAWLWAWACA